MKKKFPLCEVEWLDASLESLHLILEDARKTMVVVRKNSGYLLFRDKKRVVICSGFLGDNGHIFCDQTLVIPRGCVKEIRFL